MTKASEVTVTDAEVHAFYANAYAPEQLQFEAHRQALAAFLAPRLAAERERCANVIEPSIEHRAWPNDYLAGLEGVELLDAAAAAIRALGDE